MKIRFWYVIVPALLALGLLSGCKSLPPAEATKSAANETRTLIRENVSDESKAKTLIALVDQLENDLKAYNEKQDAHNEALVKKNADYDASREDFQKLYDAYNRDSRAFVMKIAKTHLDMQKLATFEEWAVISKPKHRIGGF